MRGAKSPLATAALLVAAVLIAAPVQAGGWRVHGGGWWGGGGNGHHHLHRRHGVYAWGRADNFVFGLSLAFAAYAGRGYDHSPRYDSGSRNVVPAVRAPSLVQSAPVTVVNAAQPIPATRNRPPGCRQFRADVTIAGRLQPAWGIACPQTDGSWRVVD